MLVRKIGAVFTAVTASVFAVLVLGCAGNESASDSTPSASSVDTVSAEYGEALPRNASRNLEEIPGQLEELAELERSGGFVPGLGIAESKLREQSGDYAGAVIALYKELSWAYAYGVEGVTGETIETGLAEIGKINLPGGSSGNASREANRAAGAALAFFRGQWKEAQELLTELFGDETEPDSFPRWMLLVCSLELDEGSPSRSSREIRAAYGAVRARYASFPEYWYRGARFFSGREARASGVSGTIAGDYAERCINLSGSGPFASECRSLLALASGLTVTDGKALLTRLEIETLVQNAVDKQKPELLEELFPLIALPDNTHTVYASGILRALSSDSLFKEWFGTAAKKAQGRLAERLKFISGAAS
jgi:hypothetical protein